MADKNDKIAGNVAGSYYVDSECIGCELCTTDAEEFFKMQGDQAVVYNQPSTDEEKQVCEDVLESCPADAIGNDG